MPTLQCLSLIHICTILYTAIQELEYLCLDRDTQAFKRQSAIKFAELVYDGKWFTPLRESMSAMFDVMDETVTGEVRLKLYKGSVTPAGAKSPYSPVSYTHLSHANPQYRISLEKHQPFALQYFEMPCLSFSFLQFVYL